MWEINTQIRLYMCKKSRFGESVKKLSKKRNKCAIEGKASN